MWAWLYRLIKAYGVFALAHSLIKVTSLLRRLRRYKRHLKLLPGPKESLLEVHSKVKDNIHRLLDLRMEMLEPFRDEDLVVAPGFEVVCNSEEAVKWMLKDEFNVISKVSPREDYLIYMLSEFIGDKGIFVLRHGESDALKQEHAQWLFQRKTASTIFTKNQFSRFTSDVFTRKAELLLQVLDKAAEENGRVDMQQKFFAFTMDSVQELFFNQRVDTLTSDAVDPYARAFDTAHANMLKWFFPNVPLVIFAEHVLPWPFGPIFERHGEALVLRLARKLSESGNAFDKNVKELHARTMEFVKKARRDPDMAKRDDLLARLLNAPGGDKLSDEQLCHMTLNFIIAGRDTTACTLSWLFFELTQHPEVQEKLQQEIDEQLGGRNPSVDDLDPAKMPYLNGCFYETLRLHPPVPEDVKIATEDVYFKDKLIPKDTRLIFSPYSMNRHPGRYPDPLSFKPERWIPFEQPSDYAFPVFQAGPRFCLGRQMAHSEAKFLTAKLLQRFSFTLQEGEAENITYSLMVTMSIKNGTGKDDNQLWILPKKRAARAP